MASLYKKPVIYVDPKSGEKTKGQSKKWWGMYRDSLGKLCRVPLAIDKLAAQTMLNKLVCKVERTSAGLIDPTDEQRKRPLADHHADFRRYLEDKGVTRHQVHVVIHNIKKMMEAKSWKFISDITASSAFAFLGDLRRHPYPPGWLCTGVHAAFRGSPQGPAILARSRRP